MKVIKNKIRALKKFQDNTDQIVLDSVRLHETEIVDFNTQDQLYDKGMTGEGKRVKPRYKPFTVKIKKAKGQPTTRVTLRDTGDFHDSFSIEYQNGQFEIVADDIKTAKLVAKYGPQIFGLNDNSMQKTIDLIRPEMEHAFKKLIL